MLREVKWSPLTALFGVVILGCLLLSSCATTLHDIRKYQERQDVESLITALQNDDLEIRGAAAFALSSIGELAVSALIEVLQTEEDKRTCAYAALSLGKMGSKAKKAIPVLIEMFPEVRMRRGKDQQIYEFDTVLLRKDQKEEQISRTYHLSRAGVPQPSETYTSDYIIETFLVGADALTRITGEDFGDDKEKWQKWWEQNKAKFFKNE